MKISGAIGITILKNDSDKFIIIFSDAHSSLPYCKNNYENIDVWLKKRLNNKYQILLEEVPRLNSEFIELWPTSLHTQKLKNLYLKNKNEIFPVDIRPFLLPFSWELIDSDYILGEITLYKYLKNLRLIFNKNSKFYKNIIVNLIKLKIKKKSGIGKHFAEIKEYFNLFLKANDKIMNKDLNYIFANNYNILELINLITNCIMEWFIILKIFSTEKISVVHTGLAHSREIVRILNYKYDFKKIYEYGIVDNLDNENIISCIFIPNHIDKYFGYY